MPCVFLPCWNGYYQFVLFRRQRTRRERRKSTWRIVGLIEIQSHRSIRIKPFRIQETASAIGRRFIGSIAKNDKEILLRLPRTRL